MTIVDEIFTYAQDNPEQPLLIDGQGNRLTYGECRNRVREITASLVDRYSDPAGKRFGLITDNQEEFLIRSLAILNAGGCLIPVPKNYRDRSEDFAERTELHGLIDTRSETFREWKDPATIDGKDDGTFRGMNPAYVRFTSGTTGDRKGTLLSHETVLKRTEIVNEALQIGPEDRIVWLLEMSEHFVSSVLLYLRNGGTLLIPDTNIPEKILTMIEEYDATFLYGAPYHYEMLGGQSPVGTNSVRGAISTTTDIKPSTARSAGRTLQAPVIQALGIIEVGLPLINLDRPEEKPESLGQVQPGYEVRIQTDKGLHEPDETTEPGTLHFRSDALFDAYLFPWSSSSEVLENGYFTSGDVGYFDDAGDFFLKGRRHNRINVGGMKFFCEEVESVLNDHELIAESRVLGKDHEKLGQVPVAEIQTVEDDEPSESELKETVRAKLPSYKVPRTYRFVDTIPRTETGKIKRNE
jgi:long-chain acyl-CoA synthetase